MAGRPKGTPKTGGRAPGQPNKVTREFREAVTRLLEDNADNFGVWLEKVADGDASIGMRADPGKALDLVAKLAEFAAPKLARTEVAHSGELAVSTKEQRDAAVAAASRANS